MSWLARLRCLVAPFGSRRPLEVRVSDLAVRRLEPRRVLSASIQSVAVPSTAQEGDTVEVSAEATGTGSLAFDWTITRDTTVIARGFSKDFSFEAPEDGVYDVDLVVTDRFDQIADTASATVTVGNVPAALDDVTATNVDENGFTTLSGKIVDPGIADTFSLSIQWGDGQEETLSLPAGTTDFSVTHQYPDDNPSGVADETVTIDLSLLDDDSSEEQASLDSVSITVFNVDPVLGEVVATDIDENGFTTLSGKIADPGTLDTFTLEIDWGDPLSPTNIQNIDLSSPPAGVTFNPVTREFSVTHQYLDDNPTGDTANDYTIQIKALDDDTGYGEAETSLTVKNVAPMLHEVDATDIDENGFTTLSGKIADPGTLDTFTLTVNWGDGEIEEFTYGPETAEFSETHQYRDDNPTGTPSDPVTIRLTLVDDDTDSTTDAATITVTNRNPIVEEMDDATIFEGTYIVLKGQGSDFEFDDLATFVETGFSDVGQDDTHMATVDWGDGSPVEALTLTESEGSGSVVGVHAYADDGLYTVTITVTDDDTGVGQQTFQVTVNNVDPILTGAERHEVEEGSPVTLTGLGIGLSDPGFDNPLHPDGPSVETFVVESIDWGDGSTPTTTITVVDRVSGMPGEPTTASVNHAAHHYADDGVYTVAVTLRDDDGSAVVRPFEILVKNVAPTLTLTGESFTLHEGETLILPTLGHFTDPGFDNAANPNGASEESFSYTVDWGDGRVDHLQSPFSVTQGGPTVLTTGSLANSHAYVDNDADNRYTITITLSDDDGGYDTKSFDVTVLNVNPTIEPLSASELLEVEELLEPHDRVDEFTPPIYVDATNLTSDGVTMLALRFSDPGTEEFMLESGSDPYEVWIDWGDQLDLADPAARFVLETPINVVETDKGITLLFLHAYEGPPDPAHPSADITITAEVRDDDSGTPGVLEIGVSDPAVDVIANPGIEDNNVAIDTTPQIAPIGFPALEDDLGSAPPSATVAVNLQPPDVRSRGADLSAVVDRFFELRVVLPDGRVSEGYRLDPDVLEDLPGLFIKLPDNRYLILLVRTENNSRRLVLDVHVREGRPFDIADDTGGVRDRPPTQQEGPATTPQEVEIDLKNLPNGQPADDRGSLIQSAPQAGAASLEGLLPEQASSIGAEAGAASLRPMDRSPRPETAAAMGFATAAGFVHPVPARSDYASRVESALMKATEKEWRWLNRLRRRPR